MELIRTDQVDIDDETTLPRLQQLVHQRAIDTYNVLFRPLSHRRIQVTNCSNIHINRRIGSVHSYQPNLDSYCVFLDTKRGCGPVRGQKVYLRSHCLQPCQMFEASTRPHPAQQSSCKVVIPNVYDDNGQDLVVMFRKPVFDQLSRVYPNFECNHEKASDLLNLAVGSIEEQARKVDEQQRTRDEEFDRHLSNFKRSHFTRTQFKQAKKYKRFISVLLKARASENDKSQSDQYFTFPFRTTNHSLFECIKDMSYVSECCNRQTSEDDFFSVRFDHKIVIDSKSVESLRPLQTLDDSVIDLLSTW